MAGFTQRIQTRTDYSMPSTNYVAGKSMNTIVARRIPVDRWREAIFMVRIHAVTPYNAGCALTFQVAPDPYTDEDPAIIWKTPSAQGATVTFTQGTDSVPGAKQLALTAPFGPLIMVAWQFTMAAVSVDTVYSVSVDLNLKGQ